MKEIHLKDKKGKIIKNKKIFIKLGLLQISLGIVPSTDLEGKKIKKKELGLGKLQDLLENKEQLLLFFTNYLEELLKYKKLYKEYIKYTKTKDFKYMLTLNNNNGLSFLLGIISSSSFLKMKKKILDKKEKDIETLIIKNTIYNYQKYIDNMPSELLNTFFINNILGNIYNKRIVKKEKIKTHYEILKKEFLKKIIIL